MNYCAVIINCSILFPVCVSENFCTVCCLLFITLIFYLSSVSMCCEFFWLLKLSSLPLTFFTWDITLWWRCTNCDDNSCHSQLNYFSLLYGFNASRFSSCTIKPSSGGQNTKEKLLCKLHYVVYVINYIIIFPCVLSAWWWLVVHEPKHIALKPYNIHLEFSCDCWLFISHTVILLGMLIWHVWAARSSLSVLIQSWYWTQFLTEGLCRSNTKGTVLRTHTHTHTILSEF